MFMLIRHATGLFLFLSFAGSSSQVGLLNLEDEDFVRKVLDYTQSDFQVTNLEFDVYPLHYEVYDNICCII